MPGTADDVVGLDQDQGAGFAPRLLRRALPTSMARYQESAADVPDLLEVWRWSWDGRGEQVARLVPLARFDVCP